MRLLLEIDAPHERELHLPVAAVERQIADRIDAGPGGRHRVVHHHEMAFIKASDARGAFREGGRSRQGRFFFHGYLERAFGGGS